MPKEIDWSDTIFLFNREGMKEQRGIDESSVVVSDLDTVEVIVGHRSHSPAHPSEWRPKLGKWIRHACELHVTHTATSQRETLFGFVVTDKGEVRLTYIAATSSSNSLKISMDLSRVEALRLARALLEAAEGVERSEQE